MKFTCFSDIHLEFGYWEVPKTDADVVIFAGDIGTGLQGYKFVREYAEENPTKKVIYVAGNHEFYGFNEAILGELSSQIPTENMRFLDCQMLELDEVIIFGGTKWTKIPDDENDPLIKWKIQRYMNDFRYITMDFWERSNQRFVEELEKAIEYSKFVNKKLVVVSHHAPHKNSIAKKYEADKEMNYAYYDDMQKYFGPNLPLWFHGHTHTNFDYTVDNTRVVCNPRGYHGYELNTGFNTQLIIEI